MARASRVAVLGGSFDRLHVGHRALLDAAFLEADRVGVGVTTDEFLRAHPKPLAVRIQPFATRRRAVERYLSARYPTSRWWTAALSDPWGRSLEPGVDALVASEETGRAALSVNRIRRRRGLGPVRIHLVPLVRGEDLLPVSARRIRAGFIDAEGRRRRPLSIAVVGTTGVEIPTLRSALVSVFGSVPFRLSARPARRTNPGPKREGRGRARASASRAAAHAEYGIGLSRGARSAGGRLAPGWIAVADAEGRVGAVRIGRNPDWPSTLRRAFAGHRALHANPRRRGRG